ncbi:hypothetical protein PACTADRAFT_29258, partial [Pachysolen tannophilus NRRL Y-2460]
PDKPISPRFPILVRPTAIISGFGRGSSELGIPTANVESNEVLNSLETGVYFGYYLPSNELNQVYAMSMSLGYNPFYGNLIEKAVEIHIIHDFKGKSFYGCNISFVILGYLRPELNFSSLQVLIDEINKDVEITKQLCSKEGYLSY